MNIFDLPGPQFLGVYATLLVAGISVALVIRNRLRGPAVDANMKSLDLQPVEVALLAEGDEHAVRTALAGLAHRELIAVEPATQSIKAIGLIPKDAGNAELRLHSMLGTSAHTFSNLISLTESLFAQPKQHLQSLGLLLQSDDRWKLSIAQGTVFAVVLAIGVYKIGLGVQRGRPVGFLLLLCLLTLTLLLLFVSRSPRRTRLGDRALKMLRAGNMGLRQTVVVKPARVAPSDFALAVALYGPAVLTVGPMIALRDALRPRPAASDNSSSSYGGSSCSSDSGGGGCGGGCGGGGCGGCGS